MKGDARPYRGAKAVLFVLGGFALACGIVAVFLSSNDAAAASLVVAGSALLALASLVEHVSLFRAGPVEVELRKIARKQDETAAAVSAGVTVLAAQLDDQTRELAATVTPLAAEYERIRSARPSSPERAQELTRRVVEPTKQHAHDRGVASDTIEFLFSSGGEGARLTALAAMQGRPAAASALVLESAIRDPASDFELYHALLAAEAALAHSALDAAQRARLVATVEQAVRSGALGTEESDRLTLAKRIAGLD